MCIRDRDRTIEAVSFHKGMQKIPLAINALSKSDAVIDTRSVSYTHLRAHETVLDLVCRLLLEKKIYYTNNEGRCFAQN